MLSFVKNIDNILKFVETDINMNNKEHYINMLLDLKVQYYHSCIVKCNSSKKIEMINILKK